jgi:hypothetical protein
LEVNTDIAEAVPTSVRWALGTSTVDPVESRIALASPTYKILVVVWAGILGDTVAVEIDKPSGAFATASIPNSIISTNGYTSLTLIVPTEPWGARHYCAHVIDFVITCKTSTPSVDILSVLLAPLLAVTIDVQISVHAHACQPIPNLIVLTIFVGNT